MPFFSRIEETPIEVIENPQRENHFHSFATYAYISTTISFYARGEKVAEVVLEGFVERYDRPNSVPSVMWTVAKVSAMNHFWRDDDPPEWRQWEEHVPQRQSYGTVLTTSTEEQDRLGHEIADMAFGELA